MKLKKINCLEITRTAIKLLTASRSKKGIVVEKLSLTPYESKAVLSEALKSAIENHGIEDGAVATTVWSPTLISRKISLPIMDETELKMAIPIEADKYIPFSVDECMLDYIKLEENQEEKKMSVLLIASKRDLIEERCKFLQEFGLKVRYLDISPVALLNLRELAGVAVDDKPYLIAYIGDHIGAVTGEDSFAVVMMGGMPIVIRDLGDKITAQGDDPETWTHLMTQIQNTSRFFESQVDKKVASIHIVSDPVVLTKINEGLSGQGVESAKAWWADDCIEVLGEENQQVFNKAKHVWCIPLGLAARGLSK